MHVTNIMYIVLKEKYTRLYLHTELRTVCEVLE